MLSVVESLRNAVVVLLFTRTILLTPLPIDIKGATTLHTPSALSALNEGARIEIDLTDSLRESGTVLTAGDDLSRLFPQGSIAASLRGSQGSVMLTEIG